MSILCIIYYSKNAKNRGVPIYHGTKAAKQRATQRNLTKVYVGDELNYESRDSAKDISKDVRMKLSPKPSHNTRKDRVIIGMNDVLPKNDLTDIRKNLSMDFSDVLDLSVMESRNVEPSTKDISHTKQARKNRISNFLRRMSRVLPFGPAQIYPQRENGLQVKTKPGNKTKPDNKTKPGNKTNAFDEFYPVGPKGGNRKTRRRKKRYTK